MPVHFKVASHDANPVGSLNTPMNNDEDLLYQSWGKPERPGSFSPDNLKKLKIGELLQSSFPFDYDFTGVRPSGNGFVHTALEAYNQHHSLIIRPDDVWIAILTQFNLYVNAHAEELRQHFVAHEGKKRLTVTLEGNRYTVDFGYMAKLFTEKIHENVVDKELKDWILPDFTTTTVNDTVVSAVIMMSTLKEYFEYYCCIICGLPSVTLEGTQDDWDKLLKRIGKLEEFGKETTQWARMLRPIIRRFIAAFDGEVDLNFWDRICHEDPPCCGPTYLSGWMMAFCVWSPEGKWKGPREERWGIHQGVTHSSQLVLDGVAYQSIELENIPSGFCDVDITVNDNGAIFDCTMVSGHVANQTEGQGKDILRPLAAWLLVAKPEAMEAPAKPNARAAMRDAALSKKAELGPPGKFADKLGWLGRRFVRKMSTVAISPFSCFRA